MTLLVLLVFGAGGFGVASSVLDPDTARLLNSVVNFVTLVVILWHGREVKHQVKPILRDTHEKVSHLDDTLGRRDPDPTPISHRRRRTDHT